MFMKSVTKTTQNIILEGSMQAKVVAEKIGKPYSTLLREINPFDMNARSERPVTGLVAQPDIPMSQDVRIKANQ